MVEVLGRQSNLILLDADGTVMDAARRVGPQQSRAASCCPSGARPAPDPDRLDPRWIEPGALAEAAGDYPPDGKLREVLVAEVQACSPLLAREVVFGVHGDAQAPVAAGGWEAIAGAFTAVWRAAAEGRWGPSVAVDGAVDGARLLAYAGYPLRSFPDAQAVTSISRAVERWFAQSPAGGAGAGGGRPIPWRRARRRCVSPSRPGATACGPSASRCSGAWWTSGRCSACAWRASTCWPSGTSWRRVRSASPCRTTRRSWRSIPA